MAFTFSDFGGPILERFQSSFYRKIFIFKISNFLLIEIISSLALSFSTFKSCTASMTEIGEGGFIDLPLTIRVLARFLHDHYLLSVVVL